MLRVAQGNRSKVIGVWVRVWIKNNNVSKFALACYAPRCKIKWQKSKTKVTIDIFTYYQT